MARTLRQLSVNQALAATAFVLGAVAVVAQPTRGASATINPHELARIVQAEVDHVTPPELADWIVQGRADYRLVDLRDAKAFAEYHIPGAEHITIASLPDAPLARNERIVLYSDGGIHSAQAWFLLKARDYRGVYMLRGGLEAWQDEVLFPTMTEKPTPEQARSDAARAALAQRFGGQPRGPGIAVSEVPKLALPKIDIPSVPAGSGAAKKKKKEGC